MQDEIVQGVGSVVKFILWQILCVGILFNLGRFTLLVLTFGRYPRGRLLELHFTRIAFTGVALIAILWTALAVFNNVVRV